MNHSAIVRGCDVCGSGVLFLGDSKVSLCGHKTRSLGINAARERELAIYELQVRLKELKVSVEAVIGLASGLLAEAGQ